MYCTKADHLKRRALQETFRLCQRYCDGVVLVDNAATSAAIKDVFTETRTILEPAGALGVAGAKAYLARNGLKVRPPPLRAPLASACMHRACGWCPRRGVSKRATVGVGGEVAHACRTRQWCA